MKPIQRKKIGNEQVCKHAIEITKSGKNIPEEIKKIEEKAKKVQLKKDREKTLKKLLSPIRPMKIHAIEPQKPFVSENNPTEKKNCSRIENAYCSQ